jgi:hypothetical protein
MPRPSRVLALVAALAALPAVAQVPAEPPPPPPPGLPPPPPPPGLLPPAPLPPPPPRAVEFYGALGYDVGFHKAVEAHMSDGTTQTIRTNGGVTLAVGADFLKLWQDQLRTRATVEVKYDSIQASNATVDFTSVSLVLLEVANVRPFRLAAGVAYSFGPQFSASGSALVGGTATYDPSLGFIGQAEYVWPFALGGPEQSISAGLRLVLQKFRDAGGVVTDAGAMGVFCGITL